MTLLRSSSFAGRGPANGKDIVVAMAEHLCAVGIPETEREAIRILLARGFRYGDVAALAADALYTAQQAALANEMADQTAPPSSLSVPTTAASPAFARATAGRARSTADQRASLAEAPEERRREDGGDAPEQAATGEALNDRRRQVRS